MNLNNPLVYNIVPSCPQVINEINHSAGVRYPLMNPDKPGKVLERVATGADKIFVLVRRASLWNGGGEGVGWVHRVLVTVERVEGAQSCRRAACTAGLLGPGCLTDIWCLSLLPLAADQRGPERHAQ